MIHLAGLALGLPALIATALKLVPSTVRSIPAREGLTREAILRTLELYPGLSQTDLTRVLGLGWGNVQYHIRELLRRKRLWVVPLGREMRFFSHQEPPLLMKQIAVLRRGRTMNVAQTIVNEPGLAQRKLAQRAEMTRKILRSYVDFLIEVGLVREEAAPAVKRYYPEAALPVALKKATEPVPEPVEEPRTDAAAAKT